MSSRTSLRALVVLSTIGTAIAALHCSSSDSTSTTTTCADDDPTTIRKLTADQQALVKTAGDRTKATLSPIEWRYLFKLRYAHFTRAVIETDPVVVKALGIITQDVPSCATGLKTRANGVDACDRFVNVDKCWADSPVSTATVPCFMWSMRVASSVACGAPAASTGAHVDAQAWDDAQSGETDDCSAPCIAGGGCYGGTCRCATDEAPCIGGCGRTKTDVINCGACGNACAAGTTCVEGVCGGAASADAGADASGG